MDWKRCMNVACGGSSTSMQWRRGWALQSGDFVVLCDKCGSAYEQSTFCEVFHSNNSGWRQCNFCGKHLHCGCIVSQNLLVLQDTGGVSCINCARRSRLEPVVASNLSIEKRDGAAGTSRMENNVSSEPPCKSLANQSKARLDKQVEDCRKTSFSYEGMRQDDILPYIQQLGSSLVSHFYGESSSRIGSSKATKLDHDYEAHDMAQSNLGNSKSPPILVGPNKFHPILPMLPISSNFSVVAGLKENNNNESMKSPITSVGKPPDPRRQGRNQRLLPRYWPRFTDQDLKQICGDSNSTIVPLFEKMLSASDVSRIGRLVLPKSCAEMYLPPLFVPEGLPLEIHDVNGKVWNARFRFWLNNNSRVYVLEGLSPCIQSMQLQARDTVTFSRMDPKGKLIMGFRKARPIVPAAQITWEEAQDLFRPPPTDNHSVVVIEDLACEEYEESPIIGKRIISIVRSNRIKEQWTPCDGCSKWRKLPVDLLLPAKWTCVDNTWDLNRCSCSAPNELTPRELDSLGQMRTKELKKQRMEASNNETSVEHESCGLETLANVALLGHNVGDCRSSKKAVPITTKHLHNVTRCSQQQPNGKGKHKPACTCNACTAHKHHLTTLMIQQMNRQSEREAGIGWRSHQVASKNGAEAPAPSTEISLGLENLPLK